MTDRFLTAGETFRYTKPSKPDRLTHAHRLFWDLQKDRTGPRIMAEAGVNAPKRISGPEGVRLPVLTLRSTPHKAGTAETPWHDEFRLDEGRVTYHGDHRPDRSDIPLGGTEGDKRLERTWHHHRSTRREVRAAAPPVLIFRTVPIQTAEGLQHKGFIQFTGLAVISSLTGEVQRDPKTGVHYDNYTVELQLLDLGEHARLDWSWIAARLNPRLTPEQILDLAPNSWRNWVHLGATALPQARHTENRPCAPARLAGRPALTSCDPGASGIGWLAARAVEHLLGQDRTRVLALAADGPTVGLRGTHRVGTGEASANLRLIGVTGPNAAAVADSAQALRASLKPGQLGVVACPEPLPDHAVSALRSPGPAMVILTGDIWRTRMMHLAEQSFDGDLEALENHAHGDGDPAPLRAMG